MLEVQVDEDEDEDWPWRRIEAALHTEFGFAPGDILALGQHFFPHVLARSGYQVSAAATRFVSGLAAASTSAPMWNVPPDGPLQYDPVAQQLSARVPLTDREVIAKLTQVHDLNADEQKAVQDLYFQPRAMLASFALLFADFASAQRRLIEEDDEAERFGYFRRQFLLCRRRCRVIARHLSHHVAAATGQQAPEGDELAALILRALAADENKSVTSWEDDSGALPALTWTPLPNGGALAALLGLAGTGLIAEYRPAGGAIAWRDGTGPLSGFGAERDHENCPVPTVLPSLGATLTPQQMQFASVHNGFLMKDATDAWLGGAQGFAVTWSGALLVEHEGTYEFWAGAPTPGDERPDAGAAEHRRWRVMLRRGQRSWVILSHHWAGEEEHRSSALPLKRGAYELTAELIQPAPEFGDDEQARPQHTGFQVKYSGPDSDGQRTEIPHNQLFVMEKNQTLAYGITDLSPGATAYLGGLYLSSLRDIRRTYQRAFKALLFTHRFALSAQRQPHGNSELGYMLAQAAQFAGSGYYRAGGGFTRHAADFDFNFLPLLDDYRPPAGDARTIRHRSASRRCSTGGSGSSTTPRPARRCAGAASGICGICSRKRRKSSPPIPATCSATWAPMPAIGHWTCATSRARTFRFTPSPARIWRTSAGRPCLARRSLAARDAVLLRGQGHRRGSARPVGVGRSQRGASGRNRNRQRQPLGVPLRWLPGERRAAPLRRPQAPQRRAARARPRRAGGLSLPHEPRRAALAPGSSPPSPRDLSDLLLLDVEAGLRERPAASTKRSPPCRVRAPRAAGSGTRLDHHPRFRAAVGSRVRHLPRLAGVQAPAALQGELDRVGRAGEGARRRSVPFPRDRLRDAQLTVAVPGGLEWWPDQRPPAHDSLPVLQQAEASGLRLLPAPREGLSLLGTPERDARPSWLALLPEGQQTDQTPERPRAGAGAVTPAGRNCRTGWKRRSGSAHASGASPPPACRRRRTASRRIRGMAARTA